MRNFQLTTMLCALFCALTVSSCTDTPDTTIDSATRVTLTNSVISVGGEGGSFCEGYTISNGIAGVDIVATTDAEWISEIKSDGHNLIFSVASNNTNDERKAFITIKYPNAENTRLQVIQAGFDGVTFQIEITDKTTTTCKSKIIPSDPTIPYIILVADIDYFYQAGITTEEELFADDYNYFMKLANEVDAKLLKEFLLMNKFAFEGETTITWTQMTPDKEYIMYVYAIEFNEQNSDYTLASPVTYTKFSLSSTDLAEVKFDVTIEVNGPELTYNISPINWDGCYYLDIYEEGDYMYRPEGTILDEDYARVVSNTWMSMISIYMQSGYGAEQLMNLMCLTGEESYSEVRKASTNYSMIIYAIEMVDGLPQVTSMPQLFNFATGEVPQSDMTLDITVENNYVRVADISVAASSDEPYTVALVPTAEVTQANDDDTIKWLLDNFEMTTYRGSIFSHVNSLQPDTAYTVLAFGYYGAVVTTPLFRVDFTTEPEGECLNSIIGVAWDGPYSLAELEARFPDKYYNYGMFESLGWYAIWSEIETTEPTQDMFYGIYRADHLAFEGEQAIINDLLMYASPKAQLITAENDVLYVMCAVIMDYKGNYSPMWVSEPFCYTYNDETKKPLEELIEKLGITEE